MSARGTVCAGVALFAALIAVPGGAQTPTAPALRDREGGLFVTPPERPSGFSDTSLFDVLEPDSGEIGSIEIEEEPLDWEDPDVPAFPDDSAFPSDRRTTGWTAETDRTSLPGFQVAPEIPESARTQEIVRPIPTEPAPYVRIRGLDKMTGRTESHTVAVGEAADLGRIYVEVEACEAPPGGVLEGTRAFLRIWDLRYDRDDPDFSGWMFADSPALSAFDHPRFDVWVISCTTSAGAVASGSE